MGLLRRTVPVSVDQLDAELLEASTPELLGALDEGSESLRVAAACALAMRGDPRALDALIEGLGHAGLRYAALEALRHLGDPRALGPAERLMKKRFAGAFERTQAAGVVARLGGPSGREHLLARLRRRRFSMDKGLAIELAAELHLEEAVPELERISAEKTDLFRGAALKALAVLRPDLARPRLLEVLESPAERAYVRADAAEALASLGGPDAEAALRRAAEDGDEEVAEVARTLLGI